MYFYIYYPSHLLYMYLQIYKKCYIVIILFLVQTERNTLINISLTLKGLKVQDCDGGRSARVLPSNHSTDTATSLEHVSTHTLHREHTKASKSSQRKSRMTITCWACKKTSPSGNHKASVWHSDGSNREKLIFLEMFTACWHTGIITWEIRCRLI